MFRNVRKPIVYQIKPTSDSSVVRNSSCIIKLAISSSLIIDQVSLEILRLLLQNAGHWLCPGLSFSLNIFHTNNSNFGIAGVEFATHFSSMQSVRIPTGIDTSVSATLSLCYSGVLQLLIKRSAECRVRTRTPRTRIETPSRVPYRG